MVLPKMGDLFDLSHSIAAEFLAEDIPIYLHVSRIKDYCLALIEKYSNDSDKYEFIGEGVLAAKDAKISDAAVILPPAIIGSGTEVRPGAYLRGAVIVGDGAVIGNSTELKSTIVFDGAQLPHYNYAGDSIIGYRAHLGAGAIVSNFRLDKKNITVRLGAEKLDTGLRKFGALIGDGCEVGSNSVICPGCVMGRGCTVYPLSSVNGVIDSGARLSGRIDQKNNEKAEKNL